MSATFKESENEKVDKHNVNYGVWVQYIGALGTIIIFL